MEAWSGEHIGKMLESYGGERTTDYFTLSDNNGHQLINMTEPPRYENGNYITAYNISYPYPFEFEKQFDSYYYVNLVGSTKWMAKWFMFVYLGGIYFLKKYMNQRDRFELRKPLVLWNIALATLSICGAIRQSSEISQIIGNFGFQFSFCFAGKP